MQCPRIILFYHTFYITVAYKRQGQLQFIQDDKMMISGFYIEFLTCICMFIFDLPQVTLFETNNLFGLIL